MNRRNFLAQAAIAAALTGASIGASGRKRLGITIASYMQRWRGRKQVGWKDAVDVLDHCHDLGAGCLQIAVRGWTEDFAGSVRDKREALNIALEGQLRLPHKPSDLDAFESGLRAAKEAGATIIRTVCLGGRRYETFQSLNEWNAFVQQSRESLERVEPVLRKNKVKLAVENHKDWRIDEHLDLLHHLDSEWIGATFDFGNNFALLEHPHTVAQALAPYTMTTHIKDMAMAEYKDGFLLSEVPLGEGNLDLKSMMEICEKANPEVQFNLEMITRDPLKVPVLTESYRKTMPGLSAAELADTLRHAKKYRSDQLPAISGRAEQDVLNFEEQNVRQSFEFAGEHLL